MLSQNGTDHTARAAIGGVPCTELVTRHGTDRTVGPYSPISPVQGCHEGDHLNHLVNLQLAKMQNSQQVTHELTPHHAHTRRRRSGGGRTAHGVDTQCDLQKRATSPSDQGASLSELRLVSIAASLPGEVSAGSLNALLRGFSVVSQHGAIQGVISRNISELAQTAHRNRSGHVTSAIVSVCTGRSRQCGRVRGAGASKTSKRGVKQRTVKSKICTNCRFGILSEFLGVNVQVSERSGACPPP